MSVMSLGRKLLDAGVLDAASLEMRAPRARTATELLESLIRDGIVTENTLVSELARELSVPRYDPSKRSPEPEALALIDRRSCEALGVLPVALRAGGTLLWVATCNPLDEGVLEEVQRRTGRRVRPVLIGPREFSRAMRELQHNGVAQQSHFPAAAHPTHMSQPIPIHGAMPSMASGTHVSMSIPPGVPVPGMPPGGVSGVIPQASFPTGQGFPHPGYGYGPPSFVQHTPPPGAHPIPTPPHSPEAPDRTADIAKLEAELSQAKVIVTVLTQLLVERGALDGEELKRRLRAERARKA